MINEQLKDDGIFFVYLYQCITKKSNYKAKVWLNMSLFNK